MGQYGVLQVGSPMERFSEILASMDDQGSNELLSGIDAWASEVLTLRSDTYKPGYDPLSPSVILDDVFGSYVARDRLQRYPGASELLVVRAIDALFRSFTEERGRGWIDLTGMQDTAGEGWWWTRLPVRRVGREEFDITSSACGAVPPGEEQ